MKFGDVVTLIDVDQSERNALVIGVRTDQLQGANGEELLSLGYFTDTQVFGSPESIILHDVMHQSVTEPGGGRRWKHVAAAPAQPAAAEPQPAAAAAWAPAAQGNNSST